MASEPLARQSVLDRLMGTDQVFRGAGDRGRTPRTWEESVTLLKHNLLRDLEWLLNTRRTADPATQPHASLQRSVYNFGLPDVTALSADASTTAEELRREIETTIELFEPRLTEVVVSLVARGSSKDRRLQFLVEATLRTEPDPERVEFDTVLEISSRRFQVTTRRPDA